MQTATSVLTLRLYSAQYSVTPGFDLHWIQPFDLGQTVEASVSRDDALNPQPPQDRSMQQVPRPELRELVGEQRCLLDIDGLNRLHPLPHEVCEAAEDVPSLRPEA